jgi:hypothetical protein
VKMKMLRGFGDREQLTVQAHGQKYGDCLADAIEAARAFLTVPPVREFSEAGPGDWYLAATNLHGSPGRAFLSGEVTFARRPTDDVDEDDDG